MNFHEDSMRGSWSKIGGTEMLMKKKREEEEEENRKHAFRRTGRPVAKADLAGGSFFRLPQSDKRVLR